MNAVHACVRVYKQSMHYVLSLSGVSVTTHHGLSELQATVPDIIVWAAHREHPDCVISPCGHDSFK